ncbi:MAG TPA: Hsp20/alpha crystallin family protein [Pyrinomonadaceae bacterium]|nr:Hsp20/alpha crystallin family protein [Pyrinomonadaceae bacterium]
MAHNNWGDWRDYAALQDRLNRLFEDMAGNAADQRNAAREDDIERADWTPASDVYETDDSFVIAIDLPGIDRNSLDVGIDDNRLTVRGERAADDGQRRGRGHRPSGRFASRFGPLPPNVDQKRIAAEYKDGVLRLRLPKRAARPSGKVKIEIK